MIELKIDVVVMDDNYSQSTVFNTPELGDEEKPSSSTLKISFTDHFFDATRAPSLGTTAWRKMDFAVLLVDKGNIGNACVAGLQHDLSMSGYHYSLLLTLIPYILSELPSNLWLQHIGPNVLLPSMTVL
ncbi:hypothetical protein BDY19DRAFT_996904 [Irpex rosettiformis]|uniref:Uncharacterized protein n=1 Tax=Irpex rosettiformis TaxID=378272 RepID=A0ACB8TTK9_9APHY|nr:hypothetical protein BDY19DRAFT_996904 [Irpex rosettiformis]